MRAGALALAVVLSAAWLPAATPVKAKPAGTASKKVPKKSLVKRKRYRSSAAAKKSPDANPVASARRRRPRVTAAVHHVMIPKGPPVTPRARVAAHDVVYQRVSTGASIPVENAAALVPFFELLYRHQKGQIEGPLRILHYGDSHTAADEWTGDLRARFQEKFGDGGSGFSLAGRPYNGYRREDVRTGSTKNWHTDGLVGRPGDGMYGLGGVSMTTSVPHEAVYLVADGEDFELFYLQQPGGGALDFYDNGNLVERISTDGEEGPGYYRYETARGEHRLELETAEPKPVRLFGWVAENPTGVTYEPLGINGAQASIVMDWNDALLESNVARRNPSLIVLAYGTNEAGRKDWTLESYRDMFSKLIERFRHAAPTATIFVIGPPDRYIHTRKGWIAMDGIDMIVEAQRQAAASEGCAFWDMRAKMGGKGSMQQWVTSGMAQVDHVHFTGPGYHMLGDAIFRDLMNQYEAFLKARDAVAIAADAPATGH